ncbi:MAG: MgtC/SapB family protein, partial [Candidatus Aenigmatarchaeota archaeon]
LVLSAILGMAVGLEREMRHKPAGLRTHTFVCMGACLFAVISISFVSNPQAIAASIVIGAGFLGAGTIFHARDKLIGLTTATEIWVLAAVGLAIGIGYYAIGIITTVIILSILILGRNFESNALKKDKRRID